jgi:DNA modification methylase
VTYEEFISAKVTFGESCGLPCDADEINPLLKPHQRDIVQWAVRGGRRAIFAAFGLGKTFIQLEIARLICKKTGKPFLICAPLGVRQEFRRDAEKLGIHLSFGKRTEDFDQNSPVICLTNYESVRDRKIDVSFFAGISLDEASVLRGFGGTKTFREMMRLFEGSGKYRFVATATPSPNEYIELLAYAAFLDVMDVGQAKTRFFKRDSTKADSLTLHAHKEREFWLWVSSWAIFLQKPSDLGYSDEGYSLPELEVYWHEIPSDHSGAGFDPSGQGKLLRNSALGVSDAAREKRDSLNPRIQKLLELRAEEPDAHRLIWHDLESERHAIEDALPVDQMRFDGSIAAATVYGSQDLDKREQIILDFSDGKIQELAAKPVLAGSGCNFQYHCSREIFLGIGFKFNDFIQAVHRCYRFQQSKPVRIDLIYTEAEREIRRNLERKWEQHKVLTAQMTDIIRQYGLASEALAHELQRSIGVERTEIEGETYRLINNDCVLEARTMQSDSVHLVLTSIPFSTQYEYTPSYNDFGHTDSNPHFFEQMDFLTPELFRILKPGRIAAIHVKDRITPSGITGMGFQTLWPFSDETVRHFTKHGFGYLGRKTIVTDVVRENNQTYRLGWTEQCKDGSRMGYGLPEYLLLFRKPPTDRSNGYADDPVIKDKAAYTRSRWQIDAHGFARSSGNRLLSSAEIEGLKHEQIFKLFRKYSQSTVYDFENHVELSESLERCQECKHIHTGDKKCDLCECPKSGGRLPVTFMLLQPASWHPDAWTDITRMLSLNSAQAAAGREMHLCPLQFDLADRVITKLSMPGEVVLDPFAGLMTVPLRAVRLKRYGMGIELNSRYFLDGAAYCKAEEQRQGIPDLFAMEEIEAVA